MVTLQRLNHDITRLADNLVPTDITSGRQLNSLIYTVSQLLPAAAAPKTAEQPQKEEEGENQNEDKPLEQDDGHRLKEQEQVKAPAPTLKDSDVKKLAQSLANNNVFKGELCLGYNSLSDLSGLYIASMFKSNGSITKLDLSGNNLTSKSAVLIAQGLMDSKNSSLTYLSFRGNVIGDIGVRRILQASQMLPTLHDIDLGVLNQTAFNQVITKIGGNESLISIEFEEYTRSKKQKWSSDSKSEFIKQLQRNKKIRKLAIFSEDQCFVENVAYYTSRNVEEYQGQIEAYLREKTLLATEMFESFQNFNKQKGSVIKDFKNMPVRQYLENSFGPKLKDALFQLKKLHNRVKDKDLQTITQGIVFVARYLVDNLSDYEKYGVQTELVEEDEIS